MALAAVAASALMTTYASADSNSTATDNSTATSTIEEPTSLPSECWTNDAMNMGGPMQGPRMHRGFGEFNMQAPVEVSSEYQTAVTDIAKNDTDVQNLISQGYNITEIIPIIKNVIEADGTLVTKASSAVVLLQNGTTGFATVNVDVANAKVTQIIITTRTVIDKSST